jgi:hypothetical protein
MGEWYRDSGLGFTFKVDSDFLILRRVDGASDEIGRAMTINLRGKCQECLRVSAPETILPSSLEHGHVPVPVFLCSPCFNRLMLEHLGGSSGDRVNGSCHRPPGLVVYEDKRQGYS